LEFGINHRKRPVTLTALCILSFIGSGLAFFTYFTISFSYNEFMKAMGETEFEMPQMEIIQQASRGFFVSGMMLYAGSLIGVSLMWRLRRSGFHFYTISQLLIALQPWVFLKLDNFPFLSLATSVIFILLYGYHLKYMKSSPAN
jgi:hypothetical protein